MFFQLPNFIEVAELEKMGSIDSMARATRYRDNDYEEEWQVEKKPPSFLDGWLQVVLIILNITITCFFILNDQFRDVKAVRSGFWRMLSVPFTAIYFVEAAIVVFSVDGGTLIREKKLYILEIIC